MTSKQAFNRLDEIINSREEEIYAISHNHEAFYCSDSGQKPGIIVIEFKNGELEIIKYDKQAD